MKTLLFKNEEPATLFDDFDPTWRTVSILVAMAAALSSNFPVDCRCLHELPTEMTRRVPDMLRNINFGTNTIIFDALETEKRIHST